MRICLVCQAFYRIYLSFYRSQGGGNETHSHLALMRTPSCATQVNSQTKKGAKLSRPSTQGKKYLT